MTRRTRLASLGALLSLAAAGCAQAPNMPVSGLSQSANTAEIQGVKRVMGFDVDRYEKVIAPKAKPQRLARRGELPSKVDGRKFCTPIGDQGKLGSCTAWAMGRGLTEYLEKQAGKPSVSLSPLFLYYQERVLRGSVNQDSGATITDGMQVLDETGIAEESTWPYDILQFKVKPAADAYETAAKHKVTTAKNLYGFDDVKTALAAGQPVAFGFNVYENIRGVKADGLLPARKPTDRMLGGHAVLAVGYDDEKQVVIVRNSWGTKWADGGYFYFPYDEFKKTSRDFWTAK